jgi:ABC-type sugar transport system permease subunit
LYSEVQWTVIYLIVLCFVATSVSKLISVILFSIVKYRRIVVVVLFRSVVSVAVEVRRSVVRKLLLPREGGGGIFSSFGF